MKINPKFKLFIIGIKAFESLLRKYEFIRSISQRIKKYVNLKIKETFSPSAVWKCFLQKHTFLIYVRFWELLAK